ncbi:MAG: DUF4202 family protein [bacterium]
MIRLHKRASTALKVAALAHDVERALPTRKVHRRDFSDYDAFKRAHAANSARIADELMVAFGLAPPFRARVRFLIENHEHGGYADNELRVLKDADALSFFHINLPLYAQRHQSDEVWFRIKWGYARLSEHARKMVHSLAYDDDRLNEYLTRMRQTV